MIRATLPGIFCPSASMELVRLGREHDGGYLVDARDISASDGLISFGVNNDWSFERSFGRRRNAPIDAYDGSVGAARFFRSVLDHVRQVRPRAFLRSLWTLIDYVWFFAGRNRHHQLFVGNDRLGANVSMARVFDQALARGMSRPFLKIDIEGSEYAILDEIVERASCTAGLVIEFHDCDVHREQIQGFIRRYPLSLVHVHANNYGPLGTEGFPKVLELTFSSSGEFSAKPVLPHPLDMPNNKYSAEIELSFHLASA